MEKIKAKDAAGLVGGFVIGNGEEEFGGVAKIQEALPGDLTFLSLPAYEKYLQSTKASVVLIKPEFAKTRDDITYIETDNPNQALQKILMKHFYVRVTESGKEETAYCDPSSLLGDNVYLGFNVVVGKNCKIGNNVKILANSVIMDNVTIEDDTLVYANVTIREGVKIGKRVIIHSGTVIGADGFGFSPDAKGVFHKVPQIGNVVIGDDVEIGSNVSIDRAALGSTIIKNGVKIDNLVQVAHNVVIGENTVISAQSGVSGSTTVGKNCILAGQVGVVGHIELADRVIIAAQSGVSKSIMKPGKYFGYPAKEMTTTLKLEAHIRNLPKYSERIQTLEKELKELRQQINSNKEE